MRQFNLGISKLLGIGVELSLYIPAGLLTAYAAVFKPNYDPNLSEINVKRKEEIRENAAILLIHGSGFNEMGFCIGRWFLQGGRFSEPENGYKGAVYSLNYNKSLLKQDKDKGIDDVVMEKIRPKILQMVKETGQNKVILIGHSMGGLLATYYAEYCALEDEVQVEKIIAIGTPFKGAPLLCLLDTTKCKSDAHMTIYSKFRKKMIHRIRENVRIRNLGKEKPVEYYCFGSTLDHCVPIPHCFLNGSAKAQNIIVEDVCHNSLIISPFVWKTINKILQEQYIHHIINGNFIN